MTMKPKNESIINSDVHSLEMTDSDKLKLKRAYNCDGCGGHQFSSTGGRFQVRSSPPIPEDSCTWTLTTSDWTLLKNIILKFSVSNLMLIIYF